MAKRLPLSTGTVTSKRFDFALDDDDFEDTPEDFIARVIAPKARSNLNCCVLSEQRMAKRPPLSTGTVKSKRFDFALDDDDFEDTPGDLIARVIAPKARSNLNCCILSEQRMAKRYPLSTGTVKSKRFDFALDDDDFEDTPGDLIARVIAPKARSNLNCCILSEQRMAKRYPLSTGTVKSKRFDFTLDDDDFEEHTRGFVPNE